MSASARRKTAEFDSRICSDDNLERFNTEEGDTSAREG